MKIMKNPALEEVRKEAIKAIPVPESLKENFRVIKKDDRIILIAKEMEDL